MTKKYKQTQTNQHQLKLVLKVSVMKLLSKFFFNIYIYNFTTHYKHLPHESTQLIKKNHNIKYKETIIPASSLSSFFSLAPPASMLNMTILGVIVDIWLPKQNLYVPSMWATNVYLPFDSFAPLYTLLPSGPVTCVEVVKCLYFN